jgi:hypothetical protein
MAQAAIRKLPIQMAVLLVTVLEQRRPELLEALMVPGDPPDEVRVAVRQLLTAETGASPEQDAELLSLLQQFLDLWPLPPT